MNEEFLNRGREEFLQKSAKERGCVIVIQYSYLVEIHLSRGEELPGHIRELFAEWLRDPGSDPEKDLAVTQALMQITSDFLVVRRRKTGWSIDEVSAIYGMNPWTIRMWVNRLGLLQPCPDDGDGILFRLEDVKRIGIICFLTGIRGMTLDNVRNCFESGNDPESKEPEKFGPPAKPPKNKF